LAAVLPLLLAPAARALAPAEDEARALAVKVTTEGAAKFNTRDAKAMAATYLDDAELTLISREKDTGAFKTEVTRGRADIEAFYEKFFKDTQEVRAKNTVEYARLLDPEMLLISGVFEPDTQSADPLRLPFVQVRVKQGDAWRIARLQLFIVLPAK
jgi:uncharacterized protein (TIGR02246 family)